MPFDLKVQTLGGALDKTYFAGSDCVLSSAFSKDLPDKLAGANLFVSLSIENYRGEKDVSDLGTSALSLFRESFLASAQEPRQALREAFIKTKDYLADFNPSLVAGLFMVRQESSGAAGDFAGDLGCFFVGGAFAKVFRGDTVISVEESVNVLPEDVFLIGTREIAAKLDITTSRALLGLATLDKLAPNSAGVVVRFEQGLFKESSRERGIWGRVKQHLDNFLAIWQNKQG